jgi:hypothetical protein
MMIAKGANRGLWGSVQMRPLLVTFTLAKGGAQALAGAFQKKKKKKIGANQKLKFQKVHEKVHETRAKDGGCRRATPA